MQQPQRREAGFSLIELLVAMLITLIISGAIYGLLASGQSAFQREPGLVDRQQNIRIAMDLIARDVANAGVGMAPFGQVFTDGLDNPTTGSVPSELVASQKADFLEMITNDGTCPSLSVCGAPGGSLFTAASLPACIFGTPPQPTFAYVSGSAGPATSADTTHPGLLWINVPGPGGGGGCGSGNVNLPAGQAAAYNPGGNAACGAGGNANTATANCQSISRVAFVRYELAPEDPSLALNRATNPSSLWRSEYGRRNLDATANTGPYVGANSPWQLIARGVEDMQIQYQNTTQWPTTPNTWLDNPGTQNNANTVIQRVRIRLSAYVVAFNQREGLTQGASTAARRGQLETIVSPRAALASLPQNMWR